MSDIRDALHSLRRQMELRWTGQFVENAVCTIDAATARITALEASLAEAEQWRSAVDDALVTSWIGTVDSFPDARTALDKLIEWSMAVAVDPAVSKPAADLVAEAEGRVKAITIALHDAIRRPMGQVPESADPFYSPAMAEQAEARRVARSQALSELAALETGEWKK